MKKSKKGFILLGITTSIIAANGIMQAVKPLKMNIDETNILGYNHNPVTALDNVFIEDGMTILPFIYENPDERMTEDRIREEFNKAGLTIKNISTGDKIGTGTEITVNENSNVYTLLIYGDINSDGLVDIDDAVELIESVRFQETKGLSGIYYKAGNVDGTPEELDISDAVDLISFIRGKEKIPVIEPESIKEQDAIITKIEITSAPTAEYMGDSLDFTNAKLKATAKSGKVTENIQITADMIVQNTYNSGIKTLQNVGVTYGGQTVTFPITLKEDTVTSLNLKNAPAKTVYNFGETDLDLKELEITVNWDSGRTTSLTADMVTTDMLSGYNSKQEGLQTVTITYDGKTVNFNVKVLNKISNLNIIADGRENAQFENNNYKVESKLNFVLGTIEPVDKNNTSTLTAEMLEIEVPEEYKDILTIEKEVDENNGAIKLKGSATEARVYTINIKVMSDGEKIAELPITIQASKNQTIDIFKFTQVGEQNYVQINKPVRYEVEVKNKNNEDIALQSIEINGLSNEFIVSQMDKDGNPITNIADLKYIEIATTKKEQGVAQFTVIATGTDGSTKPNSISLNVKAAPQITSVEIAEQNVELYLEEKENVTDKDNLGNIYTVVDINFKDEEGNKIDVKQSDIRVISADILSSTTIDKGKVAIILPSAQIKFTDGDDTIVYDGDGLNVKFYTDDKANIIRMGISIIPENDGEQVVTASLVGKTIKFVNSNKEAISPEVTISVEYKEVEHLTFNKSVTEDQSGNYVVNVGEEFTLGTVTTMNNEGPLTPEMLTTVSSNDGIDIRFELLNGEIVVKGTATNTGMYTIQPCLKDNKNVSAPQAVSILAVSNPQILKVILDNTNLEIGRFIKPTIKALSDLNPTDGEKLTIGDVTLDYDESIIDVQFIDSAGLVANKAATNTEISALQIGNASGVTSDTTTNLKITLYKGKSNTYEENIQIALYNAVPRKIEVSNSVTLYNASNENTVEVNGVNYTLVDINAFANSDDKTDKPITLLRNMLQNSGAEDANKIYITIPQITVEFWDEGELIDTQADDVIQIEYFDKDKSPVSGTSGKVASIGFGIRELDDTMEKINPSDLNNVSITLKCIATGEIKTITTSYTAP